MSGRIPADEFLALDLSNIAMLYIVEDDAAVRESLMAILEAYGFATVGYPSGGEFLDSLDDIKGEILILDLQLPDMRGYQVLEALNEKGHSLKTIAVTGGAGKEAISRAREAGAVVVLKKPISSQVLIAQIRALF